MWQFQVDFIKSWGKFQDNFGDNSVKFVNNYVTYVTEKLFSLIFEGGAKMQKKTSEIYPPL